MKVLHVITGLGTGGAEMMLYKLLSGSEVKKNDAIVISITDIGEVGQKIIDLGFPIISLDMKSGIPEPRSLLRLMREIKNIKPDVVQTWMYHADLLGGIAARLVGVKHIIWNIRNINLDPDKTKLHTRLTVKACAFLSNFIPEKIISNSYKSAELHQEQGYRKDKFIIIPNGFDLKEFRRGVKQRASVREELNIPQESLLIGLIARYDIQKNHRGFIEAASRLKKKMDNVHFLLAGQDVDNNNNTMMELIKQAGLSESFHLLGKRSDIPRLIAALDISSLSSHGEAFPNVIGEAMACGIPCVATDVGDTAWIIGDTGKSVPVDDPQALADAWYALLSDSSESRQKLGEAARKRIEEKFSIERIVDMYEQLYFDIAG